MRQIFHIAFVMLCFAGPATGSDNLLQSCGTGGGDSCDLIVMRSGQELKGRVLIISPTEIRYKRCDFQTGPDYVLNRPDVLMIHYINGTREFFKEEDRPKTLVDPKARRDSTEKAVLKWLLWLPLYSRPNIPMMHTGF